jgi:hypothetical protein
MVTSPELMQRIDIDLDVVGAHVGSLADLERDWGDETPVNRRVWHGEWSDAMARLEALHRAYVAGAMAPGQSERYRALVGKLRAALPIIERLDFDPPPVPEGIKVEPADGIT